MFNFDFDWSQSMSAMESLVRQSYDWGAPIDGFVKSGAINSETYKEITGDEYNETGTQSNERPSET